MVGWGLTCMIAAVELVGYIPILPAKPMATFNRFHVAAYWKARLGFESEVNTCQSAG